MGWHNRFAFCAMTIARSFNTGAAQLVRKRPASARHVPITSLRQTASMSPPIPPAENENQKQIVLISGGIESSTLLQKVYDLQGNNIIPLFFDYGQRAAKQEQQACEQQSNRLGLCDVVRVDLSPLGNTFRNRQKQRRHIPLYHRNAVLISISASLAAQEQADGIWIAISKDDLSWYPSASQAFLISMADTIRTLQADLTLHTPFVTFSKSDVVQMGLQLGVPFETTWSCMLDRQRHCGRCLQCRSRKGAFKSLGLFEPSDFYER